MLIYFVGFFVSESFIAIVSVRRSPSPSPLLIQTFHLFPPRFDHFQATYGSMDAEKVGLKGNSKY